MVCRATCRLRGVAVVPESFPLALEGLEGVVIADGREIRLEAVRGRSGAATLEATGTLRPADGGFVGTLDLGVQDLALDDGEWYRALPEPARRVWDRLRPSGVVDLRAGLVGLEGVEGLRWSGRLDLHDVDLDTGVDLRACEGALDFLGGSTPGGAFPLWLEGQVDLARCTVLAHHLLEDARADLRLGHQAIPPAVAARMAALDVEGARRALLEGEPAVAALTGLTARCMGGSLAGEVRVALDGPALYAGELHLAGADAAQVLRPAGRPSSGEVSGRVQGDLAFAGVGDAREGLSGVGRLRVRDARLWELPLLVGVLNVLSLKAPDTTFFREVDLRFRLEGSRIALDSLRAESDAISLDGSGSVSGDGQLSLKLYTELGQSMLHRVPVVGEVWKFIKGNVVHLKVTGTVDDPHVEPVLLDAVTTPVRRAMEEGGGARPEGEPPAGGGNGERR
ncbi:MAG: hypothetical protein HY722_04240 [Planctomycetes bacterium]|nr:hypothetical protein [Planctomycetota bacterium]